MSARGQDVEPEVRFIIAMIHQAWADIQSRIRGASYQPDPEMTPQALMEFLDSDDVRAWEDEIPALHPYLERARSLCKADRQPYQMLFDLETMP